MKSTKIPDRFNYIAAFLTLRCNLGCDYCINDDSGIVRGVPEMKGSEWIEGLGRLKTTLPITLEGGEPTLHEGFYGIIQGIDLAKNKRVRYKSNLLTNLQFDVDEFIRNVKPGWLHQSSNPSYKSIRASFHSGQMNLEDTLARAIKLQDAGFNIGLFALNLPEATEDNMKMAEMARQERMYFFIKDFLGRRNGRLFGHFEYAEALDGERKDASCRTKELLIAPDGEIYRCHRDLYHREHSISHILDEDLEIQDVFRECDNYGLCNPCDAKLKTNRYLQMGSCSVEVR